MSGSQLRLFGLDCEPSYLATLCHNEGLPDRAAWNGTVPVIIAGSAKGRKLRRPAAGTRPFTDRNREALFSSLGPSVEGSRVVDLFAGTGSLGLEALSRGAGSVTFVEWNPPAVTILRENIVKTGLGGEVVATDVVHFLRASGDRFDLAFVDPPYELPLASVEEVLTELMNRLEAGAEVVVHRRYGEPQPSVPTALELVWERRYGDAQIWRYARVAVQ